MAAMASTAPAPAPSATTNPTQIPPSTSTTLSTGRSTHTGVSPGRGISTTTSTNKNSPMAANSNKGSPMAAGANKGSPMPGNASKSMPPPPAPSAPKAILEAEVGAMSQAFRVCYSQYHDNVPRSSLPDGCSQDWADIRFLFGHSEIVRSMCLLPYMPADNNPETSKNTHLDLPRL